MKTGIKKITKLFGLLLLTVFVIQSCSDVAGPNEEGGTILSENADSQDIRRRGARNSTGSAGSTAPSCSIESEIISYGPASGNRNNVGTISISFSEGKVTLTAKMDDSDEWLIDKTDLEITKSYNASFPGGPGNFSYSNTHNPPVAEFSYTVTLSDHGISEGDEFAVAMHVNVTGASGGGSESAWGGTESGPANRKYFTVTYSCPSLIFNTVG